MSVANGKAAKVTDGSGAACKEIVTADSSCSARSAVRYCKLGAGCRFATCQLAYHADEPEAVASEGGTNYGRWPESADAAAAPSNRDPNGAPD